MTKTTTSDAVNPAHYRNHPSGLECIDVIEHLPFTLASACKYLWRAGQKDALAQELKKAHWYLTRALASKALEPPDRLCLPASQNFVTWHKEQEGATSVADDVIYIILQAARHRRGDMLFNAARIVDQQIRIINSNAQEVRP